MKFHAAVFSRTSFRPNWNFTSGIFVHNSYVWTKKIFYFSLKFEFFMQIWHHRKPYRLEFYSFVKYETIKQITKFVGNLPKNFLSVFDHFVGLALKGLRTKTPERRHWCILYLLRKTFKFFKGCLSLGPFLNTLIHIFIPNTAQKMNKIANLVTFTEKKTFFVQWNY